MGCLANRTPPAPDPDPLALQDKALTSHVKKKFSVKFPQLKPQPPLIIAHLDWTEEQDQAFFESMCGDPEAVFSLSEGELLKVLLVLMKQAGVLKMLSKQPQEVEQFLIAYAKAHNPNQFSCLRNTVSVSIAFVKIFNMGRTALAKYLNQFDKSRGLLTCMAINVGHRNF